MQSGLTVSQENEIDANVLTPTYLISRDKVDKLCWRVQIQNKKSARQPHKKDESIRLKMDMNPS